MIQIDEQQIAFSEPWHAYLFAITHNLASAGHFAWKEWSSYFSIALQRTRDSNGLENGEKYYEIWLSALEDFLVLRKLAETKQLSILKRAWTDAYLSTPHGVQVNLRNDI